MMISISNWQVNGMGTNPIVTSSTELRVSKEFCGCDNGCFHCSLASLDTAAESILACVVYTLSLMIMLISHCTVLSTKPCNWQYSLSFDHLSWYHPRHYIAEAGPLRVALMGLISSPLLLRSPIFQSPFWVENHVVLGRKPRCKTSISIGQISQILIFLLGSGKGPTTQTSKMSYDKRPMRDFASPRWAGAAMARLCKHVSWISRKYSWDCLLIIIACQVSEYDAIFSWLRPCHDGITDGILEHQLNMNPAAYPLVTLGNGSQLVGLEDEAASGKLDGLPERTGGFSTKNSRDHPNMWSFP